MIAFRDEDSASAALATLLQRSLAARRAFVRLAVPDLRLSPEGTSRLAVGSQHVTPDGRIDILLSDGPLGIIVECKVGSRKNAYQLEPYRRYWRNTRLAEPWVVWLVQKHDTVLGSEIGATNTITWNQVHQALLATAAAMKPKSAEIIVAFCNDLEPAGIVLTGNGIVVRKKICKGYEQDHAKFILESIRGRIAGLDGYVHEVNECPPCLKAGRPSWSSKFKWIHRVWLYMKPLAETRNARVPFGFKVDVPLFHHRTADSFDDVRVKLQRWAGVCHKHGLVFRRNRPGSWKDGPTTLKYPFVIESKAGLNWVTASLPLEVELDTDFNWRNDEEAISAGVLQTTRFLKLVDAFE